MNILHISVINKVATYQQRDGAIVCGNSDYQIEFTFDDEWNASTYKTARFVYSRGGAVVHQDVDFTGNTVTVPVLTKTTEVYVGIFAGELRTSTPAVIPCKLSILCESGTPAIPSPETDARIMQLLNLAISQQDSAEEAATIATEAKEATERYASEVKVIVAGNEAYTKAESDALHTDTAPPIVLSAEGEGITITDSAKRGFQGLKIYGKTTQNGTPSPDNPIPLESVGGDGEVVTNVEGANLFGISENKAVDNGVIYFKWNKAEQTVHITANTSRTLEIFIPLEKVLGIIGGKTYTMICTDIADNFNATCLFGVCDNRHRYETDGGYNNLTDIRNQKVYTFANDACIDCIHIYVTAGIVDAKFKVMLNKGSTALPYQPYQEPQQLITSTPNGLCGFPVSSGGNYTDKDGQQWICDENDYNRGVLIKRTNIADMSLLGWAAAGNVWYSRALAGVALPDIGVSDKYKVIPTTSIDNMASGGIQIRGDIAYLANSNITEASQISGTLLYALSTPIETPLSAEEIEAYKKLHTNYPTTVITSEGYANVKYVADTKNYIDNKFAQLATQIVNNA